MNKRIKRKIAKRTIVFNHTAFKSMWIWIALNIHRMKLSFPLQMKRAWPKWKRNGGAIPDALFFCMACDYAKEMNFRSNNKSNYCKYCPLSVKGNGPATPCLAGLYRDWEHVATWGPIEHARGLAIKIAKLPVKKGVKTI